MSSTQIMKRSGKTMGQFMGVAPLLFAAIAGAQAQQADAAKFKGEIVKVPVAQH